MKRLLVIPVMFLYLVAVSGILIHTHYCGKQLESWQVYVKSDEGCTDDVCTDNPAEEEGCCKDEVVVAKVTVDQNIVDFFKLQLSQDWALPLQPQYFVPQNNTVALAAKQTTNMPNAPPGRWQNIPLFKLHSSFTYYG
jgi:hypothetical protein